MIRIIVVVLALGLGAIAWVLLLPDARKPASEPARSSPAVAETAAPKLAAVVAPTEGGRDIRVVYPGPDATATVRKIADKLAAEAGPAPAVATVAAPASAPISAAIPPTPVPAAPAPAQVAAVSPAPATPPPPPSSGQAININTASVDALNQLSGVGRIGRTIASHRPYASIEELVSKRVIRKSVYDRIKDQIAAN